MSHAEMTPRRHIHVVSQCRSGYHGSRGLYVEDRVVEDIKLHQETIASDSNSPLHQIREKELEISGRVLSAKRQADEIVAAARKKAAEVLAAAESEGGVGAEETEKAIKAEATAEATRLGAEAGREAAVLNEQVEAHRADAVRIVLNEVSSI